MAKWRAKAIELFPELRQQIAESPEIMYLWCNELRGAFEGAYGAAPRDESLVGRIYAFADWCLQAPRGDDAGRDPFTAAMVAFVEHVPQHAAAREDMPRWFTPDDIINLKEVFTYHLSEPDYLALLNYVKQHRDRYRPRPTRATSTRTSERSS